MTKDSISNEYFEWLYKFVCENRYEAISYKKLLMLLHKIEFRWVMSRDQNRAEDGIDLRYRFSLDKNYSDKLVFRYLDGPCSVLEMMIALSLRCEENIMDDPSIGDRTAQWFWGMINNLGLGSMIDDRFDRVFVEDTISRFLDRDYSPNGKGGLFTIRNGCDQDLRTVEIWVQLCWYLDSMT